MPAFLIHPRDGRGGPHPAIAGLLPCLLILVGGCAHVASPLPAAERSRLLQVSAQLAPDAGWQAPVLGAANGAPDAQALARWWQAFDDAQMQSLVQQALASHTTVRQAQASLAAAQAALALARAAQGPQLGWGVASTASQREGQPSTRTQQASLSASWEPDLWGAQAAGTQAATWRASAAADDLAAARMSVAASTGQAYITRVQAQLTLALIGESLQAQQRTLELVRWQQQAGLASELDVQQARLSVAQTRAGQQAQQRSLAEADQALAVLTAQTPARLAAAWKVVDHLPEVRPERVGDALGAPADLLQRRPDLQAAQAQMQAAWAELTQVRRAGWPGLSLSGSLGLQAVTWSALGQPGAALASLAASLQGSLWDGGQRDAQVAQQQAALQQAAVAYDAALLTAVQDVEGALAARATALARQASLGQAAEAAESSLRLQQFRREAGLIDVATLLEAERAALSARINLLSAQSDGSLALIRTWTALGGDWAAPSVGAARLSQP